jgi:thiol-disulfide isomerase/thioredoxin
MKSPRKLPWGWILGIVIGIAWCLNLAFNGPSGARADLAPPDLSAPHNPTFASYDWNLLDLNGNVVPFSQFRGKAVLLNFWATWCAPCLEEMPALSKLTEDDRLKDVAFVAVALDDDPVRLRSFVTKKRIQIPVFMLTQVPPATFLDPKQPDQMATPATFLIAPDGRIATSQHGPAQWDDPSVVEFLQKLSRAR